jgi:hypothetical protein
LSLDEYGACLGIRMNLESLLREAIINKNNAIVLPDVLKQKSEANGLGYAINLK